MKNQTERPVIMWFRQDLRLHDNPALTHAAAFPFIPLFIKDDAHPYIPGKAGRWWLSKSLESLNASLNEYGLDLILRCGNPLKILEEIIFVQDVRALYWNRCYDPYAIQRDQKIKEFFKEKVECQSFNGTLLKEPWELKTQQGRPHQVFTPYWKALHAIGNFSPPLPLPPSFKSPSKHLVGESLKNLRPDSYSMAFEEEWEPGEKGAQKRSSFFFEHHLISYQKDRDIPGLETTSKLSPHLHWGELSPRQIWHTTLSYEAGCPHPEAWAFLKEIAWREFSYYLLYHFPHLPERPLRPSFLRFPWREEREALEKWQQGLTGYPMVDAGMRQLWHTGWVHNRVRMIVASFLVKHLQISWKEGAAWFYEHLVDGDVANNSMNWQWITGCGIDAAPYFRIFNPFLQGEKFDPQGAYVRRWVPELYLLPDSCIHKPWEAPPHILERAQVTLGHTYPLPLIDHKHARRRALEVFKDMTLITKELP